MVRHVIRGLWVFVISYVLFRISGIFTESSGGFFKTLYSAFVIVPIALIIVLRFYQFFRVRRLSHLIIDIGLVVLLSGLVVGYLYADIREMVLTVGQVYRTDRQYPLENVLYRGPRAAENWFLIKFNRAIATFSKDGKKLNTLVADFDFYRDMKAKAERLTLRRGFFRPGPGGMLFGIRDFGYSMHYLFSFQGAADEAFVALKLFPPGNEDYFRLVFSPHTYYISYLPQRKERPIKLRIARNKDLIYDNYIGFHEPVKYEKATLTFTEARKWTRLVVVRDPGVYIDPVSVVFFIAGIILRLKGPRQADA
ncbi:MAG: hypothetical protein D6710_06190 [Nitrospirae bacterium]|nr:MAG: hypothetical protein D6710_06190 [Nitrospirota bacterium]